MLASKSVQRPPQSNVGLGSTIEVAPHQFSAPSRKSTLRLSVNFVNIHHSISREDKMRHKSIHESHFVMIKCVAKS